MNFKRENISVIKYGKKNSTFLKSGFGIGIRIA